jgi:hypothetical protein
MTTARVPFELTTIDRTAEAYGKALAALPSWKRFFAKRCPVFRPSVNACFEIASTWAYISRTGDVYLIPRGFVFDYASIPQAAQSVIPKMGPWNPAAALHDFLYRSNFFGNGSMKEIARKRCDLLLHEVMEEFQVAELTQDTIYEAVRLGGGSSYYDADKDALATGRALWTAEQALYRDRFKLALPAALEVSP